MEAWLLALGVALAFPGWVTLHVRPPMRSEAQLVTLGDALGEGGAAGGLVIRLDRPPSPRERQLLSDATEAEDVPIWVLTVPPVEGRERFLREQSARRVPYRWALDAHGLAAHELRLEATGDWVVLGQGQVLGRGHWPDGAWAEPLRAALRAARSGLPVR
jgi:hypothetical protein